MTSIMRRRALVLAAIVMLMAGVLLVGRAVTSSNQGGLPEAAAPPATTAETGTENDADAEAKLPFGPREFLESSQGDASGQGAGGEAAEARTAMEQFAEARTAPGIVAPGAYSAAFDTLSGLTTAGGDWTDVTKVPYDADDPNYRDYWSNSSGGSGLVTGRITALAADNSGNVYVGGANGGVWRSTTGGGDWTPIADGLPSLSSGDLQINADDGSLWYATGEANTGGTSYAGSGVYRLADPSDAKSTFDAASDQVGSDGNELESTTINALRFDGDGKVWAATLRGVWYHSTATADQSDPWVLAYAPNPAYLPASLQDYTTTQDGFGTLVDTADGANNAAYKNIVNDIAIDPKNDNHLIAAIGWRSGDAYNGFYETKDGGATWKKVKPKGAINPKDIGNVSFAWASDGSKLYVMNQSPALLQKATGNVTSYLDGIYVSNNGSITGPWSQIADTRKLSNSGSALKQAVGGKGYGPGIQSWYNQFLIVDPTNANHVYAGLEEVYETTNGGSSWSTVGPYWNFYFSCWSPNSLYPPNADPATNCPQTTHPDQHSVAIGSAGEGATPYVYVGNDGGVYRRPVDGTTNRNGNATDWESLNDGSIDALQYYSVSIGTADASVEQTPKGTGDVIVNGGLQDNGGSIYRIGSTNGKMSSNFGGDGGDTYTDPTNGCNIVGEYVYLTMYMTQTCANPVGHPDAFFDPADATTITIAPPDFNARFIAPFVANPDNPDQWLAGGNSIWYQDQGFGITSGSQWDHVHTFADPGKVATAMAFTGDTAIAGWCGPCNNAGFTRGVAVGTFNGTSWTWTDADMAGVPNRYIGGVAVDEAGNLYLAMNGFSRRFTEGPGAGFNHIFKSDDGGNTWAALDGSTFPDVPSNSIKVLPSGAIVVGTDLGVMYLPAAEGSSWQRLGAADLGTPDALPVTVVMDVELGPDDYLYAATHGRGIWRIDASGL